MNFYILNFRILSFYILDYYYIISKNNIIIYFDFYNSIDLNIEINLIMRFSIVIINNYLNVEKSFFKTNKFD